MVTGGFETWKNKHVLLRDDDTNKNGEGVVIQYIGCITPWVSPALRMLSILAKISFILATNIKIV